MAERMVYYKTAAKYGEVEQTIEKSRFIGYIKPVQNREEAEAFIAEIRALHRSATHNVPAYVIGESSVIQPLRFWISCLIDFIRLLAALISRFRFPIFVWIPRYSICRTAAPSWTVGTISIPSLA